MSLLAIFLYLNTFLNFFSYKCKNTNNIINTHLTTKTTASNSIIPYLLNLQLFEKFISFLSDNGFHFSENVFLCTGCFEFIPFSVFLILLMRANQICRISFLFSLISNKIRYILFYLYQVMSVLD